MYCVASVRALDRARTIAGPKKRAIGLAKPLCDAIAAIVMTNPSVELRKPSFNSLPIAPSVDVVVTLSSAELALKVVVVRPSRQCPSRNETLRTGGVTVI